jgi:K+-sensing histidine kinase KdpD
MGLCSGLNVTGVLVTDKSPTHATIKHWDGCSVMPIDTDQLMRLLLLGFWTPTALIVAMYFALQVYNRQLARREEFYRSREVQDLMVSQERSASRLVELGNQIKNIEEMVTRQSAFSDKFLEESVSRINRDIVRRLQDTAREEIRDEIQKSIPVNGAERDEHRQNLIRELSHALYTPLSRIEAIASNVTAAKPDEAIIQKMGKAKSAVEICYAYLTAYRNVIKVSERGSYWSPDSLKEAIRTSAEVFTDALGRTLKLEIEAPDSVKSVSNIYMLAVLLPLIENATEAAQDGDSIRVLINDTPDLVLARVSNPLHGIFPGEKVFKAGFTTKPNSGKLGELRSHEGLGLTIVQNLLSAVAGASIRYELEDSLVTFVVTLPGRG